VRLYELGHRSAGRHRRAGDGDRRHRRAQAGSGEGRVRAGQADQTRLGETVHDVEAGIAQSKRVVVEDPAALGAAAGIDAIIEVASAMDYPLTGVLPAIEAASMSC
jgi:hypothetical protein